MFMPAQIKTKLELICSLGLMHLDIIWSQPATKLNTLAQSPRHKDKQTYIIYIFFIYIFFFKHSLLEVYGR